MRAFRNGDVAEAEKEAEAGYSQFHSRGADWAWKFLLLRADALAWRGMNEQVLVLLASEKTQPPNDLTIRKTRVEGAAYAAIHRFGEAELKFGDAEKLCRNSISADCTDVLLERGLMEMNRGDFIAAKNCFGQALTLARENGNSFKEANALMDLGWSALQQEHYDETMDWSDAAYKHAAMIDAGHIAQNALGNEGWAFYKLGDYEKALALFLEARDRARKIGATSFEVTWLTNIGYVYLDSGDFAKAEQYYKQSLEMAQRTNRQDVIDALVSLALVSERSGKLDQARDYADQTIALVPKDGNRLDVLYPLLVKGHVAARQHDTQQAEKIYREIEQDPKSHVFLKWESEHSLAQLYEDENKPDAAEREYRAALNTFEGARAALHEDTSLPFPANAAGIYDDYIRFLINKKKTREALEIAEYQRGRTLAEGLGVLQKEATFKPDALNAQATAKKVNGTILFYWLGEKQSYLWAITPQKTAMFTLPAKSQIEPVVQRYRKALAEQQEFLFQTTEDGLALYRILVQPAAAVISKNATVFIIPDGSLNTLNFETLLSPEPSPHYWIEDVTLTDASSLRLLAAVHTNPKRVENVLLLGNAVAPNSDYPELRKAAAEMEIVRQHFPPAQQHIFAREQATPSAYLASKPEQYSYIHFVAHGTASRMSPLDSAIVLSRSSAQEDSFKLYARDIIHHPVHAQLVTISTCYGAGARAYSGEGLVGLSWAFLRAGAHNVIGALWEVSDVSTPLLMDELYRGLEKSNSPASALRQAKLKLLHSSDYRKPFYWAPFQLYTGS
ncbi:MAG TPA: CHAT domain-containing protein [Terriglobales bacterium]|nr:CHAT domain-containing protein [Terriglobales bacterium]